MLSYPALYIQAYITPKPIYDINIIYFIPVMKQESLFRKSLLHYALLDLISNKFNIPASNGFVCEQC
jgi:hypothetical protein